MAENEKVDELAIGITIDSSELTQGLQEVKSAITSAVAQAKDGLESVGLSSSETSAEAAAGFDKSADAAHELADASKKAAKDMGESFDAVTPMFSGLKDQILSVVGVLGLLTGGAATFSNYIDQSDALGKLSTQLGISEQELDAWGKANEAAGGSAESLFESLKAYYDATGRPAEEFFKLGEKIEGMTRRQAQAYLRAQGVAWDAIPVFLEGQRAADELVAKYRETAFTAQDADNARAFRVAWMDFKTAAQDVGNSLVRAVLPAVQSVVEWLAKAIGFVKENSRAFGILGVAMAAAFSVKSLGSIKAAITGIQVFGVSLKAALGPILLIGAAVAALAVTLDDLLTFAEGGPSLFEETLKSFGMASEDIEDMRESIRSAIDAFGKLWDSVKPFIGDALEIAFKGLVASLTVLIGVLAGVARGVSAVWDFFKKVGKAIAEADSWGDLFSTLAPDLSKSLEEAWNEVTNWFSQWATLDFGKTFDGIVDGVSNALDSAWASVVQWFEGFGNLIVEYVSSPFKKALGGITKFFGGDGDDVPKATIKPDARAQEAVLAKYGLQVAGRTQVTANTTMNLTNTITTRDNPQAIGNAIGQTVYPAFRRSASMVGMAASGANVK